MGIWVATSLGLAANVSAPVKGAEILVIASRSLIVAGRAQVLSWGDARAPSLVKRISRALASAASLTPSWGGGVQWRLGFCGGLSWVAAGIVISLASGV